MKVYTHANDNDQDVEFEIRFSKKELEFVKMLLHLLDPSKLHPVDKNTFAHVRYELEAAEEQKKAKN